MPPNPNTCLGVGAEVLGAAFELGVTLFGGPVAHLGYFRDDYVLRPG